MLGGSSRALLPVVLTDRNFGCQAEEGVGELKARAAPGQGGGSALRLGGSAGRLSPTDFSFPLLWLSPSETRQTLLGLCVRETMKK